MNQRLLYLNKNYLPTLPVQSFSPGSLMDFAHNGKISEQEFLAATGHYRSHRSIFNTTIFCLWLNNFHLYFDIEKFFFFEFVDSCTCRRLGQLLTIDRWEKFRTGTKDHILSLSKPGVLITGKRQQLMPVN